jgi:hypothetical protein
MTSTTRKGTVAVNENANESGSEHRHKGVDPAELGDQDLLRELETIHRSRHDTLLYGSAAALEAHNVRMAELEGEYLRRHPERPVAPGRTRAGARSRQS